MSRRELSERAVRYEKYAINDSGQIHS